MNWKDDLQSEFWTKVIFVSPKLINNREIGIVDDDYVKQLNDSADSLKLSLTLSATGLAADKVKLLDYAKGVLKDKIPSGYSLGSDQIDFKFAFVGQLNGKSGPARGVRRSEPRYSAAARSSRA